MSETEPNITERLAQALETFFPRPGDVSRIDGLPDWHCVTVYCRVGEIREAFAALAAYRGSDGGKKGSDR